MRQPTRKKVSDEAVQPKKVNKKKVQYGTSKLEDYFAHEFLDKIGVEYTYQFEAKDIGRFFDFYLTKENLIIEIDGDYWHGNPEKYKKEDLRYHQRKAQKVDAYKTKWALTHGIPILRIWESDIRKEPEKVMQLLSESVKNGEVRQKILENRKKKHIFRKIV